MSYTDASGGRCDIKRISMQADAVGSAKKPQTFSPSTARNPNNTPPGAPPTPHGK
jgi:hypothetical protein